MKKHGVKDFCQICKHGVCDMETHLKTEEHKRNLHPTYSTGRSKCGDDYGKQNGISKEV